MAVLGRSENVRRGRGQAARQKGGGASTGFDLKFGRYAGFFQSRQIKPIRHATIMPNVAVSVVFATFTKINSFLE